MKTPEEIRLALTNELKKFKDAYPRINKSWELFYLDGDIKPKIDFPDEVKDNIRKLISDSFDRIWPSLL